eukprot:3372284-Pyramimonas_sp.AAC.1
MGEHGRFIAAAYGTVPTSVCPLQQSKDAEDYAMLMACDCYFGGNVLHTNCSGTLSCVQAKNALADTIDFLS